MGNLAKVISDPINQNPEITPDYAILKHRSQLQFYIRIGSNLGGSTCIVHCFRNPEELPACILNYNNPSPFHPMTRAISPITNAIPKIKVKEYISSNYLLIEFSIEPTTIQKPQLSVLTTRECPGTNPIGPTPREPTASSLILIHQFSAHLEPQISPTSNLQRSNPRK